MIKNVPAGQSLQAAIDSSQPGDTIIVEAGATFAQNLILPNKNSDTPITIQSSALASLPTDQRVTSGANMPRFLAPPGSATHAESAMRFAPGAHKYNFLGIEITHDPSVGTWSVVEIGTSEQSSLSQVPHSINFDRCFIHGQPNRESQRGIGLNAANVEIKNSRISEIHGMGYDTQAIACWNGPGPFRIVNNFLEGAGENVMFGGSPAAIPNLIPTDIIFIRNHCFKPLSWKVSDPSYAGKHWSVKNLFELKNARRVLIEGNIFEGNWTDAQAGRAIVFTPRPSDSGSWAVIEDVEFKNNIVRVTESGILILGADQAPAPTETRLRRVSVKNNLWEVGNGAFATVIHKTEDVTIEHNTVIQGGNIISTDYEPNIRFIFRNNIARHNDYGIFGSGSGVGNPSITQYFPGGIFTGNVFTKELNGPSNLESLYPSGNYFPATVADIGFEDNYRLKTTSPYKGKATDGKDIGVDMDALMAAQASTSIPPPIDPTPTPTPAPTPVPQTRKVAWPKQEGRQKAVLDAQWAERYRLKDTAISGDFAVFEKVD